MRDYSLSSFYAVEKVQVMILRNHTFIIKKKIMCEENYVCIQNVGHCLI